MYRINIINRIFQFLFPRPFSLLELRQLSHHTHRYHQEFFSLWSYRNPTVRALIRYIKNNNDREVMSYIATIMAQHLRQHSLEQPIVIIAVPVSPATYKQRGFNQVSHLARCIAKELAGEYLPERYLRKRTTRKQSLLPREQRFENIRNAFFCPQTLSFNKYRTVILIDDLITTGATLEELERFVTKHGARNVLKVSIAH